MEVKIIVKLNGCRYVVQSDGSEYLYPVNYGVEAQVHSFLNGIQGLEELAQLRGYRVDKDSWKWDVALYHQSLLDPIPPEILDLWDLVQDEMLTHGPSHPHLLLYVGPFELGENRLSTRSQHPGEGWLRLKPWEQFSRGAQMLSCTGYSEFERQAYGVALAYHEFVRKAHKVFRRR